MALAVNIFDSRLLKNHHKLMGVLCVAAFVALFLISSGFPYSSPSGLFSSRFPYSHRELMKDWHLEIREVKVKTPPLIKSVNQNTFLLSAIVPFNRSDNSQRNAIATLFDDSIGTQLCCVLDQEQHLLISDSSFIRQFQFTGTFSNFVSRMRGNGVPYPARQLACQVNVTTATHLSLALESCSKDINQYKPIVRAGGNAGKLGICAKVAYNEALKPERLVEWMEFQKMMGVDRVVVYTLDVSESVQQVFKLYSDLVTTVPYELPGTIIRSMRVGNRSFPQFSHDEQVAVFDCKERLSGFSHVAGIDFDEFLYPRSNQTLKDFLQTTMARKHPTAGAFYFHQQFHITDWPPSNPEQPLISLQFQDTVPPRWESQKFVYIPERTRFGQTHWVHVKPSFETIRVAPSVAVIHHYRACPAKWKDCHTLTKLLDTNITFYEKPLVHRVKVMMEKLAKGHHSKK